MPKITLSNEDENCILDALDGYGRHLRFRMKKLNESSLVVTEVSDEEAIAAQVRDLELDAKRAERLARVMRAWRTHVLGPQEEDDPDIIDAPIVDDEPESEPEPYRDTTGIPAESPF